MNKKDELINNIRKYFNETTLKTLKKTYRFREPGIIWNDNTTLSQVFEYVSKQNPIYRKTIYKLYKYVFGDIYKGKDDTTIPDGIIELDFNKTDKSNYEKLKSRCINDDVHLPKTLKKFFYGNFLVDANVLTLYINSELEIFKQNESNARINTIQLKEKDYVDYFMYRIIVQLPKNTSYMYDNKSISHIVIPSDSKFFDNEENILNLFDYYIALPTEEFSKSIKCYYKGYLYSIPKFKCFSFVVGEHTYVYDPKIIENELSGINWCCGEFDEEYLLNKVCRDMLIMLPDESKNEKATSLLKKIIK